MISRFLQDRAAKCFGNTYGYPKLPGKIWARSLTRPASTRARHFYYYRYVVKWMRFGFLAKIWYLWTLKMAANLSNYLSYYVETSKNVFSPKFIGMPVYYSIVVNRFFKVEEQWACKHALTFYGHPGYQYQCFGWFAAIFKVDKYHILAKNPNRIHFTTQR